MKKILIVYATAGIGHKKASMAVKEAFDELALKDTEVVLADALDYTNPFFKWSYLKAYLLMVNKLPTFWGFLYYLTDNFYVNLLISKLRRLNNRFNSRKFIKFLTSSDFDVVISTHFFASEVVSNLRGKRALKARLITVVTDYRLHSWWVSDFVDTYVVACEDARNDLLKWKVPDFNIKVLGTPVEPVFLKKLDKGSIMSKAGMKPGIFTLLIIGGGFGVGPIEDIVKAANSVSGDIQAIVVCGKNEELAQKIEALKPGLKMPVKALGFVDNVYDYMEISDVLISKSGGITVSESLVKELPIIVISPIIGQETRNSDFLMNHGAGRKISDVSELKGVLEDLISHKEKLAAMKEAVRSLKKPNSCFDVANMAISMCEKE